MAKRTPLVCQSLENISRDALEKYQHIIRQYVRRRNGVYALYRRGKLHYVGLASGGKFSGSGLGYCDLMASIKKLDVLISDFRLNSPGNIGRAR